MNLIMLNPKHVVFEGEAQSVCLTGDAAEFELLDHHAPIVSLLRSGEVIVDGGRETIPIKRGMVTFDRDECMILVEE